MTHTAKDLKEFIPAPLQAATGVENQMCSCKVRKDNVGRTSWDQL